MHQVRSGLVFSGEKGEFVRNSAFILEPNSNLWSAMSFSYLLFKQRRDYHSAP